MLHRSGKPTNPKLSRIQSTQRVSAGKVLSTENVNGQKSEGNVIQPSMTLNDINPVSQYDLELTRPNTLTGTIKGLSNNYIMISNVFCDRNFYKVKMTMKKMIKLTSKIIRYPELLTTSDHYR